MGDILPSYQDFAVSLSSSQVGIFLQNLLLPYRVLRENEKEIRGMFRLKDKYN